MIYLISAILLLGLHLLFLVNLQFTAWPEMFSYPYMLNNGFKLYQDFVLPYEPLLPITLSWVYRIFGYDILVLKLFTWTTILICDLLIFYISFNLIGKKLISLLPLSLYIIIQPISDGNLLWFDLATTPFILTSLLLFFSGSRNKFFFLGLFLSLAFFVKQQTGLASLFLAGYLIITKQFKDLRYFVSGLAIPAIFVFLYIGIFSNVNEWLFWTKTVPIFWYPKFPGYTRWPETFEMIKLLCLFGPPLYMAAKYWKTSYHLRITTLIFFALLLTSFPRFEFFRLQQGIAVLVVLFALLFSIHRVKIFSLFIGIILFTIMSLDGAIRNISLPARFYEPWRIEKVKSLNIFINPSDTIYLLGLESSNYVLIGVLPPKPWVDNFVWYMEIPGIQEKVIDGFKKIPPKIIFWRKPDPGNWYDLGTYQPQKIVDYIRVNYEKIDDVEENIEIWKKK